MRSRRELMRTPLPQLGSLARRAALAALLLLCGALAPRGAAAQTSERLFEEALYRETTLLDCEAAARLYQSIVEQPGAPRRVVAAARLRLSLCLSLLGRSPMATAALEGLLDEPESDRALVKIAQRRLGVASVTDPAAFLPGDTAVYLELVDPPTRLRAAARLLEGTPLQNPVSYYASLVGRGRPGGADGAGEPREAVPDAAAFLNEGFLRELQKVEAVAFAMPEGGLERQDYLLILDPGTSDIIPGLVQMGLTLAGRSQPVRTVEEAPIFGLPSTGSEGEAGDGRRSYLAMGPGLIVVGRPIELVEDVLLRRHRKLPSLADLEDFRRASSAREESILFAYLKAPPLTRLFREQLPPSERHWMDLLEKVASIDRLRSLRLTLEAVSTSGAGTDSGALAFDLHGSFEGGESVPPVWRLLASSPLAASDLEALPAQALAAVVIRPESWPERVDALEATVEEALEATRPPGAGKQDPRASEVAGALALLRAPALTALLARVDSLTLGALEGGAPGTPRPYMALRLRAGEDSDAVSALFEEAAASFFFAVFNNAASRRFRDAAPEPGDAATTHRRLLEPLPGLILGYQRDGAFLVATLGAGGEALRGGPARARTEVPIGQLPGASKALALRPAAIAAQPGLPSLPRELREVLQEVPEAWVLIREGAATFSVRAILPGIEGSARGWMKRLSAGAGQRSRARARGG